MFAVEEREERRSCARAVGGIAADGSEWGGQQRLSFSRGLQSRMRNRARGWRVVTLDGESVAVSLNQRGK